MKRFVIVLLAMFMLGTTGCKGKDSMKKGGGDSESQKVQSVCAEFFDAYAHGDQEAVAQALGISGKYLQFGTIQSAVSKQLSIETGEVEMDGEAAVVNTVITSVDIETVLHGLPEEVDSVKAAQEAVLDILEREEVPVKEFEVEIRFAKREDGTWGVCMTPELADALSGGYYSMLERLEEEAGL